MGDTHKVFIVCYASGENLELSYHFDNAELILNVNLGKQFTGGNLYFEKRKNVRTSTYNMYVYIYYVLFK